MAAHMHAQISGQLPLPMNMSAHHLPSIRHLSLTQQVPALAPMEPAAEGPSPYYINHPSHPSQSANNSTQNSPYGSLPGGSRISEIMSRKDGSMRKLPVPKVRDVSSGGTDMLGGAGFTGRDAGSGGSSKESSVASGEF